MTQSADRPGQTGSSRSVLFDPVHLQDADLDDDVDDDMDADVISNPVNDPVFDPTRMFDPTRSTTRTSQRLTWSTLTRSTNPAACDMRCHALPHASSLLVAREGACEVVFGRS